MLASGVKLKPMIVFKGLKKIPKGNFPKSIVVKVAKGASIREDLMHDYRKSKF